MKRIKVLFFCMLFLGNMLWAQDRGLLNNNFGTFSPYGANSNIGLGTIPHSDVKLSLNQEREQDWLRFLSNSSNQNVAWRFRNSGPKDFLLIGFYNPVSGENTWNLTFTPNNQLGVNDVNPQTTLSVNGTIDFHVNSKVNFRVRNKEVFIGQPGHKTDLFVNGYINANQVEVRPSSWSDYVLNKSYELRSIQELEKFIYRWGHLPDIPTEQEVLEHGIELGEFNAVLVKKIEELSLYVIQLQKQNEILQQELERVNELIKALSK